MTNLIPIQSDEIHQVFLSWNHRRECNLIVFDFFRMFSTHDRWTRLQLRKITWEATSWHNGSQHPSLYLRSALQSVILKPAIVWHLSGMPSEKKASTICSMISVSATPHHNQIDYMVRGLIKPLELGVTGSFAVMYLCTHQHKCSFVDQCMVIWCG